MKPYQQYLEQLLKEIKANIEGTLSEQIEAVFLDTPRHLFVSRVLEQDADEKIIVKKVNQANLEEYLPEIYCNKAVGLALDDKGNVISSISQPSLVLMMLEKLDIKAGQKILEIGTASGWNAAMMSKLVGEKGYIHSIEIISDLVVEAQDRMKKYKISNINLYDGDGASNDYEESFDRIMFTVGAYDIPQFIHQRLRENGLLLMVLRNRGLYDNLILLKKTGNHLESIESSNCKFVPLKGAYSMPQLSLIDLDNLPIWERLKNKIIHKQPFWWGTNSNNKRVSIIKLVGITSFLGIVEPQFELFKEKSEELAFGLIDKVNESIVVWKNNELIGYGNDKAISKIKSAFELYFSLGMPSANCFKLKVYPIDQEVKLHENQWRIERKDSQFVWSLGQ